MDLITKNSRNNKEQLEYLRRLERVQKRYIDRDFVCRKKLSKTRSEVRDIISDRAKEDSCILKRIQENIRYYENE